MGADPVSQVWERHRPTVERQVLTLEQAVTALDEGKFDEAVRLEARTAAHNLTGSAGTFGYPAASDAARKLEASFRSSSVIPGDAAQLRQIVSDLRRALWNEGRSVPARSTGWPGGNGDR